MELLLSSTLSTCPLPTTHLHSLQNGSLVFSFKAPVSSTSSTASNPNQSASTDAQSQITGLGLRKSMGFVEGRDGTGGAIIALGGKEGRAGVNVWGFQKEQVLQRLNPPVRLSTLCLSNTGLYLAGGTYDGRIFFWEVASGTLLLTMDAHYRPISALEFSHDDSCLVSGGEDAGVSVWSIGRLMNATPMDPPTPFATLTDHTLPITAIAVGLGTFPKCRVMTGSLDGTVKIWDLATSTATLLSTFSFPSPISHLAWDLLERFFFAACPVPPMAPGTNLTGENVKVGGSRVMRVDLFKKRRDELGYDLAEAVGGGGRGEVDTVVEAKEYWVADTITAIHLSVHSPTLIVGTSSSFIHTLSMPSLVPTRIIPPPLTTIPPGPITFLATLLRPVELGQGTLDGGLPPRVIMANGMGRTIKTSEWLNGGKAGRTVSLRIGASRDVRELLGMPTMALLPTSLSGEKSSSIITAGSDLKLENKVKSLEEEVSSLRQQLGKAVSLNDAMWKKVVDGSLGQRPDSMALDR